MPLLVCYLLEFVTQPTSQSELMFHYPHHIGDFDKATRHLTRLERSIYRDLMDFYYEIESQLPLDINFICRRILANSNEERTAVEQVLSEFFHKTPDGWYHKRCDAEIDKFHANISQKSAAGKASAEKRALKLQRAINGRSTGVQREVNGTPTNQEPITYNQEPIKEKKRTSSFAPPSINEVQQYITSNNLTISASGFMDYYESNGWMVGKNKMKNWQATCRTWEKRNEANRPNNQTDNRSRAKKFSDKLDEIARKSIEENGFTERVG